jgi:hypothetical protein
MQYAKQQYHRCAPLDEKCHYDCAYVDEEQEPSRSKVQPARDWATVMERAQPARDWAMATRAAQPARGWTAR